jgi:hypothetical protein
MSNEIKWTTKPFYIQSKINGSNYVLTNQSGSAKLRTIPLQPTIANMWRALSDPRGGAFLMHLGTGLALMRVDQQLLLQPLTTGLATQLWRLEDLGSPWTAINSYTDWEQKINVYGSDLNGVVGLYHWDRGADNEEWLILEENGVLASEQIQYFTDRATIDKSEPPTKMIATYIDNTKGGNDISSTVQLQRVLTTSRQITESSETTDGTKFTQNFEIKGGMKDAWEVTLDAGFEESTSTTKSFSDQSTDTTAAADTISLNVTVPAGKRYSYQVSVYNATFHIPFTSTLSFTSSVPGSQPVTATLNGTYNGVNALRSEIEVADVTPTPGKAAATIVNRIEVPIGSNGQRVAA